MGKFYAEVRAEGYETLMRTFFESCNGNSSLVIRKGIAKMKVVFDGSRPPIALISEIGRWMDEKGTFSYGEDILKESIPELKVERTETTKQPEEQEETETEVEAEVEEEQPEEQEETETEVEAEAEEEQPEEQEETETEVETEVEVEQPEEQEETETEVEVEAEVEVNQAKQKATTERRINKVPMLAEITANSKSLDEDIELTAKWLGLNEKVQEYFAKYVKVALELKNISWKDFEAKGVEYSVTPRVICNDAIVTKTVRLGNKMTILKFARYIAQNSIDQEVASVTSEVTKNEIDEEPIEKTEIDIEAQKSVEKEIIEEIIEDTSAEENSKPVSKRRIKMECMPEIEWFEEILGEINKEETIEKQIEKILNAMGLNSLDFSKKTIILNVAKYACKNPEMKLDKILQRADGIKKPINARLVFAQFVNKFAEKYGKVEQIKLDEFLKDLVKVVTQDSTINDN